MLSVRLCAVVICALWSARPLHQPSPDGRQTQVEAAPERPWVLHAPFEELARAVLVSVDPRIVVVYDLDTCSFHFAWTGGISFENPAASNSANPKPKRDGVIASDSIGGVAWEVRKDGVLVSCAVRYRGCRFDNEQCKLCFEVSVEGADRPIRIEETPAVLTAPELDELMRGWTNDPNEKWTDESGTMRVLRRSFRVFDLPTELKLSLRYARTVMSITGWPGFEGQRDTRLESHETKNCVLVEPVVLSFASGASAHTLEFIDVR